MNLTTETIQFYLAGYGITFILIDSYLPLWSQFRDKVLTKIAFFDKLLSCYFCTGFWVGFALSFHFYNLDLLSHVMLGIANAATAYVGHAFVKRLLHE